MRLKTLLLSTAILLGILAACLVIPQKSASATSVHGPGFFTGNPDITISSVDYGTNDVLTGQSTSGAGTAIDRDGYIGSKDDFVKLIKKRLASNNEQDKTGAAFIVWTMFESGYRNDWLRDNGHNSPYKMGPNDPIISVWENMILNKDITMVRTSHNLNGMKISFYSPTYNDDIFVDGYQSGYRDVLYFTDKKGGQYRIETECGNAVGSLGLTPSNASLTPDAWVFPKDDPSDKQKELYVAPGTTVVFDNTVNSTAFGTGDDRFRYTLSDVWGNLPAGDATGTLEFEPNGQRISPINPPPNTYQAQRFYEYTIPTTTPPGGTPFCRRTTISELPNYAKVNAPQTPRACVHVALTTITPTTAADPVVIATGGTTTFTHGALTTAYRNPGKQYKWSVWQWTNVSSASKLIEGNVTAGANGWVELNRNNVSAATLGATVTQVCQSLKLEKVNNSEKSFQVAPDSQYCVAVTGTVDRNTLINAQPNGTTNIEPEEKNPDGTGSVWGNTDTNTVPQLNSASGGLREWGYNHDATPVQPKKILENETPQNPGNPTATQTITRSNPADRRELCNTNIAGCPKFVPAQYGWFCGSTYVAAGTAPDPGCSYPVTQNKWKCPSPYQAETGWMDSPAQPACDSYYNPAPCQDGRAGYWPTDNPKSGNRECPRAWYCQYVDGNVNKYDRNQPPLCEYRCDAGNGLRAQRARSLILSNGDETYSGTYSDGDLHCYKPWKFRVNCSYSTTNARLLSVNDFSGLTAEVTPSSAGNNYCQKDFKYYGEYVGDNACVTITLTVRYDTGNGTPYVDDGGGNLRPGKKSDGTFTQRWGVAAQPSTATQCFNTIARPYITFNKTDVHALYPGGNGAIDTFGNWVSGQYYGSGVGYAAFATNSITSSGFKTYTISGDDNKERVFSNTAYSPGGNAGGNFGATMGKTYTDLRDAMINGPTVCPSGNTISDFGAYTTPTVVYCGGQNITITANKSPWTVAIPNSVYVIAPAINISGNVTNLKSISLIAGQLNTCYNPVESGGCGNRLYISGSISADKIYWHRAANRSIGSSIYCLRPAGTGDLPSGVQPTCSNYRNPGEVIDYSPEFSISAPPYQPSSGPTVGKYDSIRSLPPIY